ncbi:hypothetical protein [Laceyella putida]|uniref:Uncharacterized protein n=1 Tax=Laceyella putida TaxID=110101 RepID=A0ABW2RRA9_9BACL
MLYDDDHLDFEIKLKRYVHLEVLLEALNRDKKQLGHLKMAEVYEDQIDHMTDQILKDMAELRRYFRKTTLFDRALFIFIRKETRPDGSKSLFSFVTIVQLFKMW